MCGSQLSEWSSGVEHSHVGVGSCTVTRRSSRGIHRSGVYISPYQNGCSNSNTSGKGEGHTSEPSNSTKTLPCDKSIVTCRSILEALSPASMLIEGANLQGSSPKLNLMQNFIDFMEQLFLPDLLAKH